MFEDYLHLNGKKETKKEEEKQIEQSHESQSNSLNDLNMSLAKKMEELQGKIAARNKKIHIFEEEEKISSKGGAPEWHKQSEQSSNEGILESESSNQESARVEKIGPSSFHPIMLLGKGSFGEVFLVRKKNTGMEYAMKVLNKSKIMG